MKSDTSTAMRNIIAEVRAILPFTMPAAELCAGPCQGCAKKLLEYLDLEIEEWEKRLDADEKPTLDEVSKFAKTCTRIHKAIAANGLIAVSDQQGAEAGGSGEPPASGEIKEVNPIKINR